MFSQLVVLLVGWLVLVPWLCSWKLIGGGDIHISGVIDFFLFMVDTSNQTVVWLCLNYTFYFMSKTCNCVVVDMSFFWKWALYHEKNCGGLCLSFIPCFPHGSPSSPQVLTVWQQLDLSIGVRGHSESKWKFMKHLWSYQIILYSPHTLVTGLSFLYPLSCNMGWPAEWSE